MANANGLSDAAPRSGRVPGGPERAPADRETPGRAAIQTLIVDDEATLRDSCASVLAHDGFAVMTSATGNEARALLARRAFHIVLLDWYLNDVPGIELLRTAMAANPGTRVIVMTGKPSVDSSVEALGAGAWEYLPKPFSATQLEILVGRATRAILAAQEARTEQERLEREAGNSDKLKVLGVSAPFRRAIELARRVAGTDASVFLTGASGAGKELFAQFIHRHSRRAGRPMLAVNCAALPEALLESEMFGHRRGAFTGAIRDKPGLLEFANGGTLFLDELVEMPKSIQAKLLRVIQDGEVRRVGSESPDAMVNVRFIAATNRDPDQAVGSGLLREDLYYRLRVVLIRVPSLQERPDDIPILANHFLAHYWRKHRGSDEPPPKLSRGALWALRAQPWPGNVRELQNVIEHAVVLLEPGGEVRPEDLPFLTPPGAAVTASVEEALAETDEGYYPARDRLLAKFDRQYLTRALIRAGGNLSKAARLAGIDRTSFYRLMERHGLHRKLFAGEGE
ncbi:MAG TPA: sigma-54 dependent transcriptional regulator [Gemmatimonadales bacterium]|nr:sigma-54 dependent transcriptional regulator [Gemmatimonadales bacterium]